MTIASKSSADRRKTPRCGLTSLLAFTMAMTLGGCAAPYTLGERASANQDGRVRFLILHYTSETAEESLRLLTEPSANPVSAHYLVEQPGARRAPPRVLRLVPESARAWHAGRSYWAGETALNASSIGIEIVNLSKCTPQTTLEGCAFEPYPQAQVQAVIALSQQILARHPDIAPWRVLAHSDIAPSRKVDPGPQFPWQQLHEAGIGAWYDAATAQRYQQRFVERPLPMAKLQRALGAWGFDLQPTGEADTPTRDALRAFQLHFRPDRYDGQEDAQTSAILFALLERYQPTQLERLLGP